MGLVDSPIESLLDSPIETEGKLFNDVFTGMERERIVRITGSETKRFNGHEREEIEEYLKGLKNSSVYFEKYLQMERLSDFSKIDGLPPLPAVIGPSEVSLISGTTGYWEMPLRHVCNVANLVLIEETSSGFISYDGETHITEKDFAYKGIMRPYLIILPKHVKAISKQDISIPGT